MICYLGKALVRTAVRFLDIDEEVMARTVDNGL